RRNLDRVVDLVPHDLRRVLEDRFAGARPGRLRILRGDVDVRGLDVLRGDAPLLEHALQLVHRLVVRGQSLSGGLRLRDDTDADLGDVGGRGDLAGAGDGDRSRLVTRWHADLQVDGMAAVEAFDSARRFVISRRGRADEQDEGKAEERGPAESHDVIL